MENDFCLLSKDEMSLVEKAQDEIVQLFGFSSDCWSVYIMVLKEEGEKIKGRVVKQLSK